MSRHQQHRNSETDSPLASAWSAAADRQAQPATAATQGHQEVAILITEISQRSVVNRHAEVSLDPPPADSEHRVEADEDMFDRMRRLFFEQPLKTPRGGENRPKLSADIAP